MTYPLVKPPCCSLKPKSPAKYTNSQDDIKSRSSTVVATELAFRYELKLVKRPGEVMDIAASCADTVVGIMTSAS